MSSLRKKNVLAPLVENRVPVLTISYLQEHTRSNTKLKNPSAAVSDQRLPLRPDGGLLSGKTVVM